MYEYKARLVRVIDGDTIEADVDLGFYVTMRLRFRFIGIDTPEINSKKPGEREAANKAKAYVEQVLGADPKPSLVLRTEKADGFGRWLAVVLYKTGETTKNLNEELLANGLASPFKG